MPYDPSAGWVIAAPCHDNWSPGDGCTELLVDGWFRLYWPEIHHSLPNYHYQISSLPATPPPSLWIEWRFRSNKPITFNSPGCAGRVSVTYGMIGNGVFMDGDAVMSFSYAEYVLGLALNEFHTYRFESPDRDHFCFWVNGQNFWCNRGTGIEGGQERTYSYLQFGAGGGCAGSLFWIPDGFADWDYIRFGTVGFGEQVTASDPPNGVLAGRTHGALDRFAITFDSPNFVYLEQITVESTGIVGGGDPVTPPSVIAVRRRDNDPPETMELVLDGPLPLDATTTFTIDDGSGAPENVIFYSLRFGDANGDGVLDANDLPDLLSCLQGPDLPVGPDCRFADRNHDGLTDLADFAEFQRLFTGGP